MQQTGSICAFTNSDSWVILSPIEQSIKRKIESVGTPLKDWDINIYRGVLTGYNEAFIISTEKRYAAMAELMQTKKPKTVKQPPMPQTMKDLPHFIFLTYPWYWIKKECIEVNTSAHFSLSAWLAFSRLLYS